MLPIVQEINFLFLNTRMGIEIIDVQTIVRVEALSSYSKLFFSSGKVLVVSKVLSRIETEIASQQFIRIHRKHLINCQFIHQYRKRDKAQVELLNGEFIDVSKRKRTNLMKYLYAAA